MTIKNGNLPNAEEVITSFGRILARQNYVNGVSDTIDGFFRTEKYTAASGDVGTTAIWNPDNLAYELTSTGVLLTYDDFDGDMSLWDVTGAGETGGNINFNTSSFAGYAYGKGITEGAGTFSQTMTSTLNFHGKTIEIKMDYGGTSNYSSGGTPHWGQNINFGGTEMWSYSTGGAGQSLNFTNWRFRITYVNPTTVTIEVDPGTGTYGVASNKTVTSFSGLVINCYGEDANGAFTLMGYAKVHYVKIDPYSASSIVKENSVFNITPKSMVIYANTTLPTDTNITVDISDDGGSTYILTDQPLDEYIDTTSLSGTDISLKFNLTTTDTAATPKLTGWSAVIMDS